MGIHRACLIQIGCWPTVTPSTQVSLIFSGTMSLAIGQKVGTSTGIPMLRTEICHGSFSTNRCTHILYQPQQTRVSRNNSKESRRSLSELESASHKHCLTLTLSLIKIRETHREPIKVRNASNGVQTRLKIYCNCAPGDNPSQSETSGHIGGNGNHPCRKCELGDTQKVRETDDGFHASFYVGVFLISSALSI